MHFHWQKLPANVPGTLSVCEGLLRVSHMKQLETDRDCVPRTGMNVMP